jgi:hypothetical protein
MFAFLAGLMAGAVIGYVICALLTLSQIADNGFEEYRDSKE